MLRILSLSLGLYVLPLPVLAQEAGSPTEGAASEDAETPVPPRPRPDALSTVTPDQAGLDDWLGPFRGRALAQGLSRETVDAALSDVTYLPEVIERDRAQAEFTRTVWDYLDAAVSEGRVTEGLAAIERQGRVLDAIEARYGVDREILAAIWGIETAYGTVRGEIDVISGLATLAHDGRRSRFFEAQLIGALKILEAGDVAREDMTGSWAGAMGHTQFIPTTFLTDAVDFTGDGKRDIWGDNPADALASSAAYLARHGWVKDMPWGLEVTVPEGFDYTLARRSEKMLPSEWAEMGIVGRDGAEIANYGPASLLLPAGANGVALLTFANFDVLSRYNTADAYVIAVGHLADRLSGGDPFEAEWPRGDRVLTQEELSELQRRLTAAGFDTQGVDGRVGPNTRAAIRAFQRRSGLLPDGYASLLVLDALRGG